MRHTEEVRLVTAPAIVGESVLLNLLPDGPHVRPVTLRAISPCMLWALTIRDLEHIFNVSLPLAIAPPSDLLSLLESLVMRSVVHAAHGSRSRGGIYLWGQFCCLMS